MSSKRWVLVVALIGLWILGVQTEAPAAVRLVYMTAGDVNMLALGQNVLGPEFSKKYPGRLPNDCAYWTWRRRLETDLREALGGGRFQEGNLGR